MKNTLRNLAAPAMLTLAVLASPAWAQQTAPASATSSSSMAMHREHAQKRADIVEQRITDLHAKLQITDQQSKQWNAFAQTMRDNAHKTDQAFRDRADKLATQNADEAMKSYAALAQLHAENMQKLSAALSDLYAVLSDPQKQTADAMYRNGGEKHHQMSHKHKSGAPAGATSAAMPASN